MNIYEKLMLISNEVESLSRDLNVEMSNGKNYSAISEKAVLDAIKPLEIKHRVYSYPVKRTRNSQVMRREWKDANGQVRYTTLLVDRIDVTYRFVDVDNPQDYIDVDSFGTGIDTGDKGPGKAMTYADKYALMKAYKLSAGNAIDPDTFGSPAEWDMDGSIAPPDYAEAANMAAQPAQPESFVGNTNQVWTPPGVESLQAEAQPTNQQQTIFPPDGMAQSQREYEASLESLREADAPPITNEPSAKQKPPADGSDMTVEEARKLVVPIGTEKGKTLGELLATNRSLVAFYAGDKFKNSKYLELKAAARRLLESA